MFFAAAEKGSAAKPARVRKLGPEAIAALEPESMAISAVIAANALV